MGINQEYPFKLFEIFLGKSTMDAFSKKQINNNNNNNLAATG
jgi:hypothetical protein